MRGLMARAVILIVPAAAGIGCGGSGGSGPGDRGLITVEVTPTSATLFTLAPANTVQLAVVGKDQDGRTLGGLTLSYSSGNEAVATVSADGLVTAAGAGTTQITAAMTDDDATESASATVTVQAAPGTAMVTAPQFTFLPHTVDIADGGGVTWSFGGIHHSVDFLSAGSPADIPELTDQADSRIFATSGLYRYRCGIHPEMTGTVRVH